jgi:branched-chain amino acid transport system substrate-binding protein
MKRFIEVRRTKVLTATTLVAVTVGAVAFTTLASGANAKSNGSIPTLKVGASLCLSGSAASAGDEMQLGIQLGQQYLASQGIKVNVVTQDSAANPTSGVVVMNSLVSQNVNITMACSTPVILASLPIAQAHNVVFLNASASGPQLVGLSKWLWNVYPNNLLEVKAMADYMYKTLHYRSVGVEFQDDTFGNPASQAFVQVWKNLGGDITSVQENEVGAPNDQTQVAKFVSQAPQAIYLLDTGADGATFIKNARDGGLNVPIFSNSGIESPTVLTVAGPDANGMVFTAAGFNLTSKDAITKSYVKAFDKASNSTTAQPASFTTSYFDTMLVVGGIAKYLGAHHLKPTGQNIQTALHKGQPFPGVGGAKITFNKQQDATIPLELVKVVNDTFTFLAWVGGSPKSPGGSHH